MILTNTLALVDSFMVGRYDLMGVSAITTTTQIQFLFGPVYFAILMAVGIYTVQYHSSNKTKKLKQLAGIALILLIIVNIINYSFAVFLGNDVINYLTPNDPDGVYTAKLGIEYLEWFKYSLLVLPYNLFFVYQFRAIKNTKIVLYLSFFQSILNIVLNFFLIYGIFIFPELGIKGSGIATFISRLVVTLLFLLYAINKKAPFIGRLSEMFSFKSSFFMEVFQSALPLILVELGFGLGNVIYLKIYSLSGSLGFNAFNITKSISFIINAFVIATASTAGIMAGTYIAKEENKKNVKEQMRKVFRFITLNSIVIILISTFILPFIVLFFTKDPKYLKLTTQLLFINGIWMSLRVYSSSFISILKSGNDNKFVLFLDAGLTYLVGIPLTLIVYFVFHPGIIVLRSVILVEFAIKVFVGYSRYKKGIWIKKL